MAHDVFLVSARDDADAARLIVRRLRALKFKVWYDAKYEDETFDAREARAALESQTVLVLWSKAAVKSDWVRAAAAVGKSKPGLLVQAGLDGTVPYEPFSADARFGLDGLTTRTTPEAFYELAEELGRRDGRRDLRAWMDFGPRDDVARAAWIDAHPADPIARDEQKKKDRAAAIGLAASGRTGISDEATDDIELEAELDEAAPDRDDLSDVRKIGSYGKAVRPVESAAIATPEIDVAQRPSYLNPPYTRVPGATVSAGSTRLAGTHATAAPLDDDQAGAGLLAGVCGMIALLLFAGWANRSPPVTALNAAGMPAIANARMPGVCPAGSVPAYLVRSDDPASRTLETGPIIDDTTPLQTGPIIDDTKP